jgi:hypothetical protein
MLDSRSSKRRRLHWAIPVGLVAVIGLGHLSCGPLYYWSPKLQGTIIDESTGLPLSNVVVVALWKPETFMGGEGRPLWGAEAITHSDGRFALPATRPHIRPPFEWFSKQDPVMWIYKPGYAAIHIDNSPGLRFGYAGPTSPWPARRDSYWNGRTIPLSRATNVQVEATSYETLMTIATFSQPEHLDPGHYPLLWDALALGYTRFPSTLVRGVALSPSQAIAAWKEFGNAQPHR